MRAWVGRSARGCGCRPTPRSTTPPRRTPRPSTTTSSGQDPLPIVIRWQERCMWRISTHGDSRGLGPKLLVAWLWIHPKRCLGCRMSHPFGFPGFVGTQSVAQGSHMPQNGTSPKGGGKPWMLDPPLDPRSWRQPTPGVGGGVHGPSATPRAGSVAQMACHPEPHQPRIIEGSPAGPTGDGVPPNCQQTAPAGSSIPGFFRLGPDRTDRLGSGPQDSAPAQSPPGSPDYFENPGGPPSSHHTETVGPPCGEGVDRMPWGQQLGPLGLAYVHLILGTAGGPAYPPDSPFDYERARGHPGPAPSSVGARGSITVERPPFASEKPRSAKRECIL